MYVAHLTIPIRTLTTETREVLLGITCKDCTIIVASKAAMRGASILKVNDDKTRKLNKNTLMAFVGEPGDTGTAPSPPHPLSIPH